MHGTALVMHSVQGVRLDRLSTTHFACWRAAPAQPRRRGGVHPRWFASSRRELVQFHETPPHKVRAAPGCTRGCTVACAVQFEVRQQLRQGAHFILPLTTSKVWGGGVKKARCARGTQYELMTPELAA